MVGCLHSFFLQFFLGILLCIKKIYVNIFYAKLLLIFLHLYNTTHPHLLASFAFAENPLWCYGIKYFMAHRLFLFAFSIISWHFRKDSFKTASGLFRKSLLDKINFGRCSCINECLNTLLSQRNPNNFWFILINAF